MNLPEREDDPTREPDRKKQRRDKVSNTRIETGVLCGRYRKCWNDIFSYLSRLDDVFALFETNVSLRSLLEKFIREKNPELLIDNECLTRYPLEAYDHLYKRIGPLVTTLTVYKVTEERKMETLKSHFKNAKHLHLKRMFLADPKFIDGFSNLLSFKLSECVIDDELTLKGSPSLNLHVNMSTNHRFLPWNNGTLPRQLMPRGIDRFSIETDSRECMNYLPMDLNRSNVKHVTLERLAVTWELNLFIESLRIVDCDATLMLSTISQKRKYSKLNRLSLETVASVRDFVEKGSQMELHSLEILTLSHLFTPLDWLKGLKKLKQLRILRPIEKYKEVALLEALAEMENEIDAKYNVCPQPKQDQMINILVDDCLLEIISYLDQEDIFNLAQVHSRFKELISSVDVTSFGMEVLINGTFLCRHPLDTHLIGYEALCNSLSTLRLTCSGGEFKILISALKHLRRLIVWGDNFKCTAELIDLFPMVEALEFFGLEISTNNFSRLLQKLAPTLKVFNGNIYDHKSLQHLHNLKELEIYDYILNEDLGDFWKQNQGLELLIVFCELRESVDVSNQERNWKEIANMKSLSVLEIHGDPRGTLPKMEYVKELKLVEMEQTESILRCFGNQLEMLTLEENDIKSSKLLGLISGFKNLRYFHHDMNMYPIHLARVMEWMTALPKLNVIQLCDSSKDLEDDLHQFLIASNRILYLNGVKYPHQNSYQMTETNFRALNHWCQMED